MGFTSAFSEKLSLSVIIRCILCIPIQEIEENLPEHWYI